MAENIGKIVVSIEAEVAELRKGLASAEAEFKKSADRLAAEQAKLSTKFKKSWTELASKISVVTTVLKIAEKSMKGLTAAQGAYNAALKEGATAQEALGHGIMAVGDAGIPIVSDFINVAEALASVFYDIEAVLKDIAALQQRSSNLDMRLAQIEQTKELVASMEKQLEVQKQLTEIAVLEVRPEGNEFEIFNIKRAMQRVKIEERLQQQIEEIQSGLLLKSTDREKKWHAERVKQAEELSRATLELFDYESNRKIHRLAMFLEEKAAMEEDARKEKSRRETEALKKIEQDKIDAAKKVADKTMDLQTQLNIMIAKQAGDDEKARTIAIEARYRKMSEGATVAQQKIIQQMKAIELGAKAPAAEAAAKGGGTATVSTAIGSFTVASGEGETKKQTGLLKTIANATEKMTEGIDSQLSIFKDIKANENRAKAPSDDNEIRAIDSLFKDIKANELGLESAAVDKGRLSVFKDSFIVENGTVETKKQTGLLKRIANATEKLGDTPTGVSVILAA